MTYRVVDSITGRDITDDYDWVLFPNGELHYIVYGDVINDSTASVVFNTYNEDIP